MKELSKLEIKEIDQVISHKGFKADFKKYCKSKGFNINESTFTDWLNYVLSFIPNKPKDEQHEVKGMKKLTIFNETTSREFLIPDEYNEVFHPEVTRLCTSDDRTIADIPTGFGFVIEDVEELEEITVHYNTDCDPSTFGLEFVKPCIIHNTDKEGNCLKCGQEINNELKEAIQKLDKIPVVRLYDDEPPCGDCSKKKSGCRSIGCQFGMDRKKTERYPMCADQDAQIDCRITGCEFYKEGGNCSNISPAITLNESGKFACWSHQDASKD